MYGKGTVEILKERTLKEFNVDTDSLNEGSHRKVYVKCNRCGEEFTREWRYLYQKHACPLRIKRDDGTELKWCNKCGNFLTLKQFASNSARYDGLHSLCGMCSHGSNSSKKRNEKYGQLRKSNLDYWLKTYCTQKQLTCKKKGLSCDLDYVYLKSMWEKQSGRCFYFNIPLAFAKSTPNSASLDRISPNKGYTKDNVVWASKMANFGKNAFSMENFQWTIQQIIAEMTDGIVRVEVQLRDKEAVIPHRDRASDAGFDLHSVEEATIKPGSTQNIDTGLAMVAPLGCYITIEGRSSMFTRGIVPMRGIIDGGYTGNLKVSLWNISNEDYVIQKGDKIAQALLHRIVVPDITQVKEISEEYNIRGTLGYGSSGK